MEILKINGWNIFYQKNSSNVVDIRFSVLAGSEKEENESIQGIAHFVEHLIFKGTEKRGYLDISDEIAAIGGQSNAFTSKTIVSYFIRIIRMNWVNAFEILSDMFFNSVFDEKEIEKERNVILEEAKNNLDDHETFILEEGIRDTLSQSRGHRIIGSFDSISSISRKDIIQFMEKHYIGDNILLSISGNVEKKDVINNLSVLLPPGSDKTKIIYSEKEPLFKKSRLFLERDKLQQAYSLLFYEGFGRKDPRHDAQKILLNAVGGGMHSLLFKTVREEHGLCYHIDAGDVGGFNDASIVCVSTNLSKKNVDKTRDIIFSVLNKVKKEGIDSRLLEISKVDYTSYIAMNTETSTGYVMFFGLSYLLDTYREFDELYKSINSISNDQIIEAANLIFQEPKDIILS